MEGRVSKTFKQLDQQLSPQQPNYFYFPCGSISSYQNSVEFQEDEIQDSFFAQTSIENEEKSPGLPDYISYDQVSLEKMCFEDKKAVLEFTASFENFRKFSEIGINVDLIHPEIEEIRGQLSEKSKTVQNLKNELVALEKVKNDLEKIVRNARSEVDTLKNKLKLQESEFLKVKIIIQDICDEDGTSRTSRNEVGSYGFEGVLGRLEVIRQKLKEFKSKGRDLYPKKFASPAKGSFKEKLSLMSAKKNFDVEEEACTERPKSSMKYSCEGHDKITYKEVLRDLKEITTRASKALKNSSLNRRSSNLIPYSRRSVEKNTSDIASTYRNY